VAIYELVSKVGLKRHFKIYEKFPKNITSHVVHLQDRTRKAISSFASVKFFSGNLPTERPEAYQQVVS